MKNNKLRRIVIKIQSDISKNGLDYQIPLLIYTQLLFGKKKLHLLE